MIFFICYFYFLPCPRSKSLRKAFHFGQWEWCLKYQTGWWRIRRVKEEDRMTCWSAHQVQVWFEKWIWKKRVWFLSSLSFFFMCGFRRQTHRHIAICNLTEMRIRYQNDFITMESVGMCMKLSRFAGFLPFGKEILRKWMLEYQNTKYQSNEILK